MSEITDGDARKDHGITTCHNRTPEGELRFRLKKSDGTAYIRTEAEIGGWQQSHFHRHVLETYVVQSGWMALGELVSGELRLAIVEPGQVVTTRPNVIHNVYLPKGAVIHTVKHGSAVEDDREIDERTKAFDKVTHAMSSELDIRATSIKPARVVQYSDEYRHFDTLIWQVPAWSTAIFALTIQALFDVLDSSNSFDMTAAGLLAVFGAFALACFSYVMLRFRCHQHPLKTYSPTPKWKSASTITQCLVTLESMSLLAIAFMIFEMRPWAAIAATMALAAILIWIGEWFVDRGGPAHRFAA
jgi:hypothetical protein